MTNNEQTLVSLIEELFREGTFFITAIEANNPDEYSFEEWKAKVQMFVDIIKEGR